MTPDKLPTSQTLIVGLRNGFITDSESFNPDSKQSAFSKAIGHTFGAISITCPSLQNKGIYPALPSPPRGNGGESKPYQVFISDKRS